MSQVAIKRSDEREFAFKMFYAAEYNSEPWSNQIAHLDEQEKRLATSYVEKLATVYSEYKNDLDQLIIKHLKNWELQRIAVIDKVILRLALAEILYFEEIPPEVSINEAIELAKKYSTGKSGKFINGILDTIYRKQKKTLKS